ncbi:MAG: hypothetical protein ACK5KR_00915 [Breznakia sp.]
MKKIYGVFKGMVLLLQFLAVLVYVYYWCINKQGSLFEISISILVVCSFLDVCFFPYEKRK